VGGDETVPVNELTGVNMTDPSAFTVYVPSPGIVRVVNVQFGGV
jgi:hypothetical protein